MGTVMVTKQIPIDIDTEVLKTVHSPMGLMIAWGEAITRLGEIMGVDMSIEATELPGIVIDPAEVATITNTLMTLTGVALCMAKVNPTLVRNDDVNETPKPQAGGETPTR